jgi:hypothetical protein
MGTCAVKFCDYQVLEVCNITAKTFTKKDYIRSVFRRKYLKENRSHKIDLLYLCQGFTTLSLVL